MREDETETKLKQDLGRKELAAAATPSGTKRRKTDNDAKQFLIRETFGSKTVPCIILRILAIFAGIVNLSASFVFLGIVSFSVGLNLCSSHI